MLILSLKQLLEISHFAVGHENENILRPRNVLRASGKDK
jgi:hypothetical protein